MYNIFFRRLILPAFCALLFLASCTKDKDMPNLADGTSVVITDLPGDTSARMGNGGGAGTFKPLYFSFTTDGKVEITDADKASLKWDLAFTGPYNSEVYVNAGSYEFSPGFGGPGKGAAILIDQPYDQVTEVPDQAAFDASDFFKIGWDSGNGRGWFFYSLNNHICVPVKNRTFAIRTANGQYAKLEIINIYKGNPAVVTDLFWPAPYLTFRYYVQPDGSRHVKTK